jgi:hypothetical protein
MSSITPTDSGYVFKKTVYGEFVISLVRCSWESECIASMILSGNTIEEVKFRTNLSSAVFQYNMFCEMAKKISDHYGRTSLYARRRDEERFFNAEA